MYIKSFSSVHQFNIFFGKEIVVLLNVCKKSVLLSVPHSLLNLIFVLTCYWCMSWAFKVTKFSRYSMCLKELVYWNHMMWSSAWEGFTGMLLIYVVHFRYLGHICFKILQWNDLAVMLQTVFGDEGMYSHS